MADVVAELEECAFRAWPAAEVHERGGWRLRWSSGATRRGNSVLPSAATGRLSLDARIDDVVAFYTERGGPARFQLSPVAEPAGLDAALAERGFAVEAPVSIQVAGADDDAVAVPEGLSARVDDDLEGEWFAISAGRGRFASQPEVYRGFLDRIGARAGFAIAHRGSEPVAVGLGVVDGAWCGVFAMLTVPEHRGRGAGRAALGAWARARAAAGLYLQVERDNAAALRLYERAGFREAYGYHYRIADLARSALPSPRATPTDRPRRP
jgi:ribosomal protein S18 acetylase RimI-like enzyme